MARVEIQLTVDAVILAPKAGEMSVLLIRRKHDPFKDHWAIPGGFVEADEALEAAAKRELKEETSLDASELKQMYTFGDPGRDPRGRVVSVAFVGQLDAASEKIHAADDARDVRWFPVGNLPSLAFDHGDIIDMALRTISGKGQQE